MSYVIPDHTLGIVIMISFGLQGVFTIAIDSLDPDARLAGRRILARARVRRRPGRYRSLGHGFASTPSSATA